jgi:hypothetical protein
MAHTNANRATWDRMARQDQFIAVTTAPDPRAAFLIRAACRWDLLEVGEMDLDEAFDGPIEPFMAIAPCACQLEILERWERSHPPKWRRK